jgi:hypothetical protein
MSGNRDDIDADGNVCRLTGTTHVQVPLARLARRAWTNPRTMDCYCRLAWIADRLERQELVHHTPLWQALANVW